MLFSFFPTYKLIRFGNMSRNLLIVVLNCNTCLNSRLHSHTFPWTRSLAFYSYKGMACLVFSFFVNKSPIVLSSDEGGLGIKEVLKKRLRMWFRRIHPSY